MFSNTNNLLRKNYDFKEDFEAYMKYGVTIPQLAKKYNVGHSYIKNWIKQYGGPLRREKPALEKYGLKLTGIQLVMKEVIYAQSPERLKGKDVYCTYHNLHLFIPDGYEYTRSLLPKSFCLGPLTLDMDQQKLYDMVHDRYEEILEYRKAREIDRSTQIFARTYKATLAEHEKLKAYLEELRKKEFKPL